jgi:hypothetical protein
MDVVVGPWLAEQPRLTRIRYLIRLGINIRTNN